MTLWMRVLVLCFCLVSSLTHGRTHLPRIIFTEKETAVKRLPLQRHDEVLRIIPVSDPHTVIGAGKKHLNKFNFQNPQQISVNVGVLLKPQCINNVNNEVKQDCSYEITVVHQRENSTLVFLCGTNGGETLCCDVDLSHETPQCISSENINNIKAKIKDFGLQEGQPSVFIESQDSSLYVTHSGSEGNVGIRKFGKDQVTPAGPNKEQHYVGLVLSRQTNNMHNKVYGFYNEKNRDGGLNSDQWIPFVTRVCTNDRGGAKRFLQYRWTSQMNARLFCGDASSRQSFSQLVDVATVNEDQDITVYALFRNEWNMSAVCVYTIKEIEKVFKTSPFKGMGHQQGRSRECVEDSTKIYPEVLNMIKNNSEMEYWVRPVTKTSPLLVNHHIYTHIRTDRSHGNNQHTVLYLSLHNGGIHKVTQTESQAFIIAEYRLFNQKTHNINIVLHPPSKSLYVSSRNEVVKVDVLNCRRYGDSCGDCVLARDPYCGWNGTKCTPTAHDVQHVTVGDLSVCGTVFRQTGAAEEDKEAIELDPRSKYFLQCPVLSHHAQYTWKHDARNVSCTPEEQQCVLLISSMSPEDEGAYSCVSEEEEYAQVRAEYRLRLKSRAVRSESLMIWICLGLVLIKSLSS